MKSISLDVTEQQSKQTEESKLERGLAIMCIALQGW